MKTKVFPFLLALLLTLVSCKENNPTDLSKDNDKYKVVTPTQEELDEIEERLNPILSTYWEDYDSTSDNIYDDLFSYNFLDYVYPEYYDEVTKYVAEPIRYLYEDYPLWFICIGENDPLGKFDKIPESVYDENGVPNEDLAYRHEDYGQKDIIIGHTKYSAPYIDWLVEGVWNGKIDHVSFFEFEDRTKCYYYDSFYYLPHIAFEGGGGIFHYPRIESINPIEKNKYEIKYTILDDLDEPWYNATAVIAMKESQDGFRFWSIYSIDTEWIETDFSSVG